MTISVHGHNDLGMAVANFLGAIEGGARQVLLSRSPLSLSVTSLSSARHLPLSLGERVSSLSLSGR